MRVGFRSICSPEHLETAKRLGFKTLELMWIEYAWEHRQEILKNVKKSKIAICAIVMGVERNFKELKEDVDYALAIGTKVVVIHPKFVDPNNKEYIDEFLERYAKGVAYAVKRGVDIAMPSCWHGPLSWDTAFSLIPELKLKYDPSFSYQAGRNYRMELVKYSPKIVYVHAKDEMLMEKTTDYCNGITKFNYAPAGMGDIHWGSVISLLYEANYKGDIGIEPHNPYWSGDKK
ncbi:MAG: sugar phosphate isomerase/epimerase, partial [Candidatus Omnitrophica bacterium]|nr:sugar phosphate isomerase/epimerase [Candidatus Omnitrophota bacterium]